MENIKHPHYTMEDVKQNSVFRYLISLTIVSAATFVELILWDYLITAPFLIFFAAVIASSIYGNGVFAMILSSIIAQIFFVEPYGELSLHWPHDFVRLALFLLGANLSRVIIVNELTEKKRVEEALALVEEREKELETRKRMRERFVLALNHDLKTPLTMVKLTAEMAMKRVNNPDYVKGNLQKQLNAVARMEDMIANLLDASKIQAGSPLVLKFEGCDLKEIVSATVSDLEMIYGKRFKIISNDTVKGTWSYSGIRRILENLCTNAVKYGDETKDIEIKWEGSLKEILLHVNNKGPVLADEDIKNLFSPFKRLKETDTSKMGWGLGLSLVKGLSESMGGNISVTSHASEGTTFTVHLPYNSSNAG